MKRFYSLPTSILAGLMLICPYPAGAQMLSSPEPLRPSTDVWETIKYGDISPSLYTGTINVTIPFYTYKDAVSGFNALQLNLILLNGSTDLETLRENLSPLPDGVTELQLDFLFGDYAYHWIEDD